MLFYTKQVASFEVSMLNISRKINRKEFPPHNIPVLQWTGDVLRIRAVKKGSDISKFAIISPKKSYTTKPERNIFKRRVFSELRQHLHKLDSNPHGYFIIFPVIHTKKISFSSIKNDLEKFVTYISR